MLLQPAEAEITLFKVIIIVKEMRLSGVESHNYRKILLCCENNIVINAEKSITICWEF